MSDSAQKTVTIALAGNPNCGKSALFNRLTGARQRVANFSGVTVARKEGETLHKGWLLRFIDLPGTYSLSTLTMEEKLAQEYLLGNEYDLILNIMDAGNLERNLFLTTQLIESGRPRVYVLNMADEARRKGITINLPLLSTLLDGPALMTVARTGEGVDALLDLLVEEAENKLQRRGVSVRYDSHLEEAIGRLTQHIQTHLGKQYQQQARWRAIQLLEGNQGLPGAPPPNEHLAIQGEAERYHLAAMHGDPAEVLLANGRYGFIRGLLKETVQQQFFAVGTLTLGERLDGILLHRLLGLPLFFLSMWVMFQTTFTLGKVPAEVINNLFSWLTEQAAELLAPSLLREVLTGGILPGVGGVAVFLPTIILLFLFIALFEDSGYMARVAFLTDRAMHIIGLHGKAFIPLLMGFGCNVPAIMATRAMEHPRDRLVTILINPFMSCSARLPVFVLFAAAFFPEHEGSVLFSIYMIGIVTALLSALLLKKTLFKGISEPFVLELPPYRLPTLRSVVRHMWEKAVEFLKKMGGVILAGSIIIWFLQAYPREVTLPWNPEERLAAIEMQLPEGKERQEAIKALQAEQSAAEQEGRYLGQLGRWIQPIFAPLGFDWRASIALLTGFVAKEVVISTLGVLYHSGNKEQLQEELLQEKLTHAMPRHVAYGFMLFTLLYIPCLATIAVIRRETMSWRWPLLSASFGLSLAWLSAWTVHTVGGLL
ncbi:ferrous iron transport protein B [Candidatus Magnetaquicoccus inordinatus]|uniref:ferrous iron transport protein B n=1 Tax=Candidatus Magnetaquicoccus inordinatus TaxID=2496818 RepID=UPI00102CA782|nr:ferrous iron transport protein B [Candidatus Magnetaquicoccus inordinatus]